MSGLFEPNDEFCNNEEVDVDLKMFALGLGLNAILLGCAGDPPVEPPPPEPTIVNLQIDAGADLNADSQGKGAPVMLRVYELRDPGNFNTADFFALFNSEQATLAADLARKQEMLLQPGTSKKLTLKPEDAVTSVGFFAAFRQVDTAQWRAGADIKAHQTHTIHLKVKNNQLVIEEPAAQ
jgi:type VI secretion system protein VasD